MGERHGGLALQRAARRDDAARGMVGIFFAAGRGTRAESLPASGLSIELLRGHGPRGLLLTPSWAAMRRPDGIALNLYIPGTITNESQKPTRCESRPRRITRAATKFAWPSRRQGARRSRSHFASPVGAPRSETGGRMARIRRAFRGEALAFLQAPSNHRANV